MMSENTTSVKVETVTERKEIMVGEGYLRGSPSRVEVDVCVKCGAIVFDPLLHHTWHRSNVTRA